MNKRRKTGHVPRSGHGQRWIHHFNRFYFAQTDKQGAVIVSATITRRIADYIIDLLGRPCAIAPSRAKATSGVRRVAAVTTPTVDATNGG